MEVWADKVAVRAWHAWPTYALERLIAVVLGLLDPIPVGLSRLVAVSVVLALRSRATHRRDESESQSLENEEKTQVSQRSLTLAISDHLNRRSKQK